MRAAILLMTGLFACAAATAQDAAPAQTTRPAARAEAPLPPKIKAEDDVSNAPIVTIRRQDNGDTVQEYRENGRLTMVKVTTSLGVSYSLYDTNGDGLLDSSDYDGPVGPVYYTLYKWN